MTVFFTFDNHVQLRLEKKSTIWHERKSSLFHFQLPGKLFVLTSICMLDDTMISQQQQLLSELVLRLSPKIQNMTNDWRQMLTSAEMRSFLRGAPRISVRLVDCIKLNFRPITPLNSTPQRTDVLSGLITSDCRAENMNFVWRKFVDALKTCFRQD